MAETAGRSKRTDVAHPGTTCNSPRSMPSDTFEPAPPPPVTRNDVAAAALRIAGRVRRTPVLRLSGLDLGLPHDVALKLELLQLAGSFKPRGAFNRMLSAASPLPPAGVVAASGGNHGAAVACAARALGVRAEIFVPEIAGAAKRALIAAYGAQLVVGGAAYDQARQASERRAAECGALLVHAYDQPEVLAGQGTVAAEFEADAPELTHLLVAVGGGGLIGGIAAWHAGQGGAQVVGVEPEGCPALFEALRAGARCRRRSAVWRRTRSARGRWARWPLRWRGGTWGFRAGAGRGDPGGAARALGGGEAGGGAGRGRSAGRPAVRRLEGAGGGSGRRGGLRRELRAGKRGMND